MFTNLEDMLRASAFDPEYDLGGHLTEDVFYKHLYVHSEALQNLNDKFVNMIESLVAANRVIFIRGYAGNGKTTFVRTFMRNNPDYDHVYYDFQERGGGAASNTSSYSINNDEVTLMINKKIRGAAEENILTTFKFIVANQDFLKDNEYISKTLYERLYEHGEDREVNGRFVRECMDNFEFKDTFTCFFTHLFLHHDSRKKKIIYFDNLDIATMEYIANTFLIFFQDALLNGNLLSRSNLFADREIEFRSNYRFVFSLRDANDAIINHHLASRIGLVRVPFTVSFEGNYYKEIVTRRIKFIRDNFPADNPHNKEVLRKFSTALNALIGDKYFQEVFVKLYNYDYRAVVSTLLQSIINYDVTETHGRLNYGIRGILMFGIIDTLITQDFLRDYLKIVVSPDVGYCYIDRVMLTILINSCNYERGLEYGDESDAYEFYHLVKDLHKVYGDIDMILDSIARCFLYHERNWVHLVTLLNKKVDSRKEFILEHRDAIERIMREPNNIENVRIRNHLNEIKVKVNPAGFTYLRYILPHFEFYSKLARNTEPLFVNELSKDDKGGYRFEGKIDNVLALVETHIKSMKNFFFKNYVPAGVDEEEYRSSKYCFRHLGSSRIARDRGPFHSTRIITTHIDYIDYFRHRLINNYGLSGEEVQVINESLVKRLQRYTMLLTHSFDKDVQADLINNFNVSLRKIQASNYTDRQTRMYF